MKILLLVFLVGCAVASVHEALDDTAELLYHDLMFELEDEGHFYYAEDDDVRTELGKKLRETLNELIEKIKERFENGKGVRQEVLDKLKELREKLREKGIDIGAKAKEALKKIRERVQKFLDDLLENLKTKSRRHVDEDEINEALADSRLKDLFRKLKKALLDKIDKEALKQKIHDIFGKGNEMADSLLEMLNKKGDEYKQKLLDLIDRYLGKNDEKRSIKEMWEKVKDYFKDLHIDLKEKFMKFGEWVKDLGSKGIEKGKSKIENIRNIAKELIDHTKGVSKDVAAEALEFLRPYKEDLGALWDQVKDSVKDIINRKSKRHVDEDEIIEELAYSKLQDLFRKLKKALLDKIDKETLKQRIHDIFGKGNEMADSLLEMLNKKGDEYKQKLLDLIDRYLGKNDEKRSIKEMWEKVKDYFKDLHIDLKEKFMKFGEWVKDLGSKGIEKGKSKIENIRNIAKELIDHTKGVSKDVAAEALEFLRPYKEDLGALWDQVKDSVKDILKRESKRHVDEDEIIEALADSKLRDLFRKLKKALLDKFDKETLKQKIHDIFGKGNEMADSLLEMLNKKGDEYKQKLLDLIDRYLGKNDEKRSIKEMWEKVKDYFKDLHIDLKEKFMKFGEWVKELGSKGLEKGKSRIENIRNIAKEFIDHTKGVSKDVAAEALEFLRPYKDDLGALWDQVKDTVKDIISKKD